MQIGMVGLGRMGGNMARRLMNKGHDCVVYDHSSAAVDALGKEGGKPSSDLKDLVGKLAKPRIVWVMLPAGQITEATVADLFGLLEPGDIIIDGGNAFYKDDVRRGKVAREKGIHYVDAGTSGGVWGIERGYCLMIGGDDAAIEQLDPIFDALAPGAGSIDKTKGRETRDPRVERGYMHCGPVGAGRFAKMIHNGIEYGLMQAYAEGLEILAEAGKSGKDAVPEQVGFKFDIADISEVWRRGSVVSSWLLDLTAFALAQDPHLESYSGFVEDSGEGRWTIMAALEEAVPADVLSAALYTRFRSRQTDRVSDKLLSAMRKGFGGHVEPKSGAK
jgi:6-phosphogluconate dehydrogenase